MAVCGNNCTAWRDHIDQMYKADPDIAGIGVSLDLTNQTAPNVPMFRGMDSN